MKSPHDSGIIDLRALLEAQARAEDAGEHVPFAAPPLSLAPAAPPVRRTSSRWAMATSFGVLVLAAVALAAVPSAAPAVGDAATEKHIAKTVGGEVPARAPAMPVPILASVAEPAPAVETTVAPVVPTPARVRPRPAPTPERVRPADRWETGGEEAAPMESSLDELLDRALGSSSGDPRIPTASLPETPTRRQVSTTLRALEGDIRECGEGGVARVRLVVDGSTGRVTSATVSGEHAGSTVAACVARTVRTARFPHFERERFVIDYPYAL